MEKVKAHIVSWLKAYSDKSNTEGFVIGVSGGIDSAVTSILCAETQKKVLVLNMPIRQSEKEYLRAEAHIDNLKKRYSNVSSHELNLSCVFFI